jgi:hypothetical protein
MREIWSAAKRKICHSKADIGAGMENLSSGKNSVSALQRTNNTMDQPDT